LLRTLAELVFRALRPIRACVVTVLCLATLSCTQVPQPRATPESTPVHVQSATAEHDLSADERLGGHTLQRHIGRSDADLRERLERERHISAASTYTDRAAAEHAVGQAVQQNQSRIERWLARSGGHPNLVLDYHGDQSIGRVMNRGDLQSVPCSNAVVVLKWAEPDRYYVLTSYPECR